MGVRVQVVGRGGWCGCQVVGAQGCHVVGAQGQQQHWSASTGLVTHKDGSLSTGLLDVVTGEPKMEIKVRRLKLGRRGRQKCVGTFGDNKCKHQLCILWTHWHAGWVILGHSGLYTCNGSYWVIVGHSGSDWDILGNSGSYWVVLGHSGS